MDCRDNRQHRIRHQQVAPFYSGAMARIYSGVDTGDIAAEISKLKAQDGPLLQVHGSWQLIQALLKHKLIDEFRLWTFPVVVGAGKRLFAEGAVPINLKLIKFEACPSGAFLNFYQLKESATA